MALIYQTHTEWLFQYLVWPALNRSKASLYLHHLIEILSNKTKSSFLLLHRRTSNWLRLHLGKQKKASKPLEVLPLADSALEGKRYIEIEGPNGITFGGEIVLLEGKKVISKNLILPLALHVIYMIMGGPSGNNLVTLLSDYESWLSEAVYREQTDNTSSLNSPHNWRLCEQSRGDRSGLKKEKTSLSCLSTLCRDFFVYISKVEDVS